jgi:hypothetical protein
MIEGDPAFSTNLGVLVSEKLAWEDDRKAHKYIKR